MKLNRIRTVHIIIFIILCFIIVSLNVISSETPSNQTPSSNINVSNTSAALDIEPNAAISITVTPATLNLGTLLADNIERSYLVSTNVTVRGTRRGTLYVRSGGDLTQTTNATSTISLTNLKYNGFGNAALPKTSLTTTNAQVNTFTGNYNRKLPVNYYLSVHFGTNPGTYRSTIVYSLIG